MAHRRVKDIAYDEDDLDYSDEDDYYGDEGATDRGNEELSVEDKEQMRVGTINVREALGAEQQGFFTDAQIQEALWHYYYDVGKSVTYLKNQAAPQQSQQTKQQKPKQVSKFDQAAASAAQAAPVQTKSGPSPDDVVLQAQAKASAAKKQSSQKKDSVSVAGVTNGVSGLSVEDTPAPVKVKSKNLDVLAEYAKAGRKNGASFVVIGHVDHGKSTLMGRLLYDLKVIDQRSIDKLRKEATDIGKSSFALAWVMDATSDERERGVTVDIATNNFETEKTKFTILDAPGHRDFIPNMIAGASQADFAVLVIDASTNSFEAGLKGQTREHAQLVRSMGCQRIIVAVNKMDSANWSQDRFEEIKQQIFAFLEKTGFQGKNIAFVPCSGLTGENVVAPAPEAAPWYTSVEGSQTLVQALESFEPAKAAVSSSLRLPISDIFRGGVTNPLSISGKIEGGSLQVGDQLLAMPASETVTVKGIEIDNEPADWAVAGQIVTLHLSDIDPVHLRIADVLCDTRKPIRNIKSFTTKILAFEHVLPMQVDVHRGRLHVPGRITRLVAVLDKSSGDVQKKKPRVVQPGAVARVRVELDTAVPLEVPGRIVLRAAGATVAAGLLEQVDA
ncbi:P-loop containing nucleoside triphosphate hydrolase protein [Delphinella strobiligena]|nr:P-loop containing nucleoside triphosphate hydrolase protein [Delphinella strobiligena]